MANQQTSKPGRKFLGNWVEERQCAHIDQEPKTIKALHVEGHKGILSTDFVDKFETISTNHDSYSDPKATITRQKGSRTEILEIQLYNKISSQVNQEFSPPMPPAINYTSTTKTDFHKDFVPQQKSPTKNHDLKTEQPVTYWSENIPVIHGVTNSTSCNKRFTKNTAFSKPINEYFDEPKPGEEWQY